MTKIQDLVPGDVFVTTLNETQKWVVLQKCENAERLIPRSFVACMDTRTNILGLLMDYDVIKVGEWDARKENYKKV